MAMLLSRPHRAENGQSGQAIWIDADQVPYDLGLFPPGTMLAGFIALESWS